jgi:hypothetical protein
MNNQPILDSKEHTVHMGKPTGAMMNHKKRHVEQSGLGEKEDM